MGGVAAAGLRLVRLVTRAEHDHRLSVGGLDHRARVGRDLGAVGERPEVERLEVGVFGVFTLDEHHRLARPGRLAVVERAHRQFAPRRHPQLGEGPARVEDPPRDRFVRPPLQARERRPGAVERSLVLEVLAEEPVGADAVAVVAGAHVQDGERVVRADDGDAVSLLEDLHRG